MKKTIIILLAVMLIISSASLAEDLSSLSDEEFLELYKHVTEEMASRFSSSRQEYPEMIGPAGNMDEAAGERVTAFFCDWYQNRFDDMLALCASGWKAKAENPGLELAGILANRTALNMEIIAMSGEPDDTVRTVCVISTVDRNNGTGPSQYFFQIVMEKEADGLWYIHPEGLQANGQPEPQADPVSESAEEPRDTSGITMLFYSPEGGRYYHADRNCKTIHEQYLPLMGSFTYAELEDEPYKDLQPCSVCEAPLRPESQDRAVRFRDVADAAGEFVSIGEGLDYLTVVTEKNGKYIRTVTLPDDHARELYMASMGAEDSGKAFATYQTYAWSLPMAYTEELTAKPKEQAELDALDGKTVGQLLEEGYSLYEIGGGENLPTTVTLSCGLFNYDFETDASFEQYREDEGWERMEEMKVKGGRLSGFSGLATNPDYLADGTYKPQVVPHVTAEEAAAADRVPPADEYTVKAWPLTAESYAELLNNTEDRYGQVYMIKGVVHQVLSQSPLRIIINSGEDGKSQPVVVEYPAHSSFSPEEGVCYRIYADVTSSCYILPVLTARYSFTGPAADPADEPASLSEAAFIVPNVIPAKSIEDFLGEWHYFRVVNEDGSEVNREEILAEGIADDHAEFIITEDEIELYAASLDGSKSVKYEFVPDDGSLRILNGSDELPVLHLADNGMLILFVPAYGLSSGSTTAYLVRVEP